MTNAECVCCNCLGSEKWLEASDETSVIALYRLGIYARDGIV